MTVQFRGIAPIDIQNNAGQYGAIQNANLVSSDQNSVFTSASENSASSTPAPPNCGGSLNVKA